MESGLKAKEPLEKREHDKQFGIPRSCQMPAIYYLVPEASHTVITVVGDALAPATQGLGGDEKFTVSVDARVVCWARYCVHFMSG
jgi:hypothetical protein